MVELQIGRTIFSRMSDVKALNSFSKEDLVDYSHCPETELSILVLKSAEKKEFGALKDYLQVLCDTDKKKIDAKDSAGMTALHCAVACGSLPAVILLLKYGANVNAKDMLGFTPLFLATGRYPNTDIATRLLKEGHASVDAVTETGATALHGAAFQGNMDSVRLLLDYGADPRMEDNEGTSPFDLAKDTDVRAMLHDAISKGDSGKETSGAICSNCKKSFKERLKRCSQCHVTLYCSRDCQVEHWKGHKSNCLGYVIAKPLSHGNKSPPFHLSLYHVMGSQKKTVKMFERNPGDAPQRMEFLRNKKFIVKVQLPLDAHESIMMVYNIDRTCEGFIHPDEKSYDQLAKRIKKEGYLGIKAFFWAELLPGDEGKFKVFHGKTAPSQKW